MCVRCADGKKPLGLITVDEGFYEVRRSISIILKISSNSRRWIPKNSFTLNSLPRMRNHPHRFRPTQRKQARITSSLLQCRRRCVRAPYQVRMPSTNDVVRRAHVSESHTRAQRARIQTHPATHRHSDRISVSRNSSATVATRHIFFSSGFTCVARTLIHIRRHTHIHARHWELIRERVSGPLVVAECFAFSEIIHWD